MNNIRWCSYCDESFWCDEQSADNRQKGVCDDCFAAKNFNDEFEEEEDDMRAPTPAPQVQVFNHGSIVQFMAVSDDALQWLRDNLVTEGWQWMGQRTVCVEPRYASAIAEGLAEEGFL